MIRVTTSSDCLAALASGAAIRRGAGRDYTIRDATGEEKLLPFEVLNDLVDGGLVANGDDGFRMTEAGRARCADRAVG